MRKIYNSILLSCCILLSCSKHTGPEYQIPVPPFLSLPVVSTGTISDVTSTSAKTGGDVTSDGGLTITAKGVCWSTSPNPTIALATKTIDGTGPGPFTSNLTGLTTGATYYVRAYATNMLGTSYGNEAGFVATTAPTLAVLSTLNAVGITTSSASCGGDITSEGNVAVTARGICWSLTPNPTTADHPINAGSGPGVFTTSITGLTASTTYHVRAWATNSVGTSYGNNISFTTANPPPPPSTVTICSQVWMTRNLDVTTYRNGDPIPEVSDPTQWKNLTTGAWCYVNGDASTNATYGKMYNWYAITDPRGLAPTGWHIPSKTELSTLATCVGGEYIAGGPLKTTGTNDWMSPNTGATNSSGFSALPGGRRTNQGVYNSFGTTGSLWSSTEQAPTAGWGYSLFHTSVLSIFTTHDKVEGLPVRLVKD
jgi:uncharacterized protein (TIGR02145 family)